MSNAPSTPTASIAFTMSSPVTSGGPTSTAAHGRPGWSRSYACTWASIVGMASILSVCAHQPRHGAHCRSNVTRVLSEPSLKTHGKQEIREPAIRTQDIEAWIELQPHEPVRTILQGPGQPGERLISIAKSGVDEGDAVWRHVPFFRRTHQRIEGFPRVPRTARHALDMADRRLHHGPARERRLGLAELCDRLVVPALLLIGAAEPEMRQCELRVHLGDHPQLLDRRGVLTAVVEDESQIRVDDERRRIERLRPRDRRPSLVEPRHGGEVDGVPVVRG